MITFNVVQEPYGWAIRMGERMTTPFWSRDQAIREARCLARDICRHGALAEVIVTGVDLKQAPEGLIASRSSRVSVIAGRPGSDDDETVR